jgi:hypothetical protein
MQRLGAMYADNLDWAALASSMMARLSRRVPTPVDTAPSMAVMAAATITVMDMASNSSIRLRPRRFTIAAPE